MCNADVETGRGKKKNSTLNVGFFVGSRPGIPGSLRPTNIFQIVGVELELEIIRARRIGEAFPYLRETGRTTFVVDYADSNSPET